MSVLRAGRDVNAVCIETVCSACWEDTSEVGLGLPGCQRSSFLSENCAGHLPRPPGQVAALATSSWDSLVGWGLNAGRRGDLGWPCPLAPGPQPPGPWLLVRCSCSVTPRPPDLSYSALQAQALVTKRSSACPAMLQPLLGSPLCSWPPHSVGSKYRVGKKS